MDRVSLKKLTHNAKDFLSVKDPNYKQWVFRYTFLELEKDLGENGDITTSSVLSDAGLAEGTVVCEASGIVAGLEEIKYFLSDSDPRFKPRIGDLSVQFLKNDGDKVSSGDHVLIIRGNAADILAVERVVLNLIARMSGIASYTRKMVAMVSDAEMAGTVCDVLITPTRKTLWGLLDKKAVTVGGGGTHRLNLSDAILIKDNHLSMLGGSVSKAIKNLSEKKPSARFIEIEVETPADALKAAESLSTFTKSGGMEAPSVIMFDNMKLSSIVESLDTVKAKGYYDNILFEASGGINESNLVSYVKTGVDIISMGSLTSGVQSLSMKMEIKAPSFD